MNRIRNSRAGQLVFPPSANAGAQPDSAKTSRPQLSSTFPRTQLFEMLDSARRRVHATLVYGPPGAGKTTLIASYLESRNLPCLWYQIDPGDNDVATFFHYFGEALAVQLNLDRRVLTEFVPGTATDVSQFARLFFRRLYSSLRAPMIVVLDDYHEITPDSRTHDVIRVACEETPINNHIIIAGRSEWPPQLARMRMNQTLVVIEPADLVLTLDETRGIAALHNVKLPSAGAMLDLHVRSAGSTIILVLLLKYISHHEASDAYLSLRPPEEHLLFDYFAGEVLKGFDRERQNMLCEMALLPTMTLERVNKLTGSPKAGHLLVELAHKNYFISRLERKEDAFQFHPLFRAFLLGKVQAYPDSIRVEYLSKAADLMIADGDEEAALELLEQARDWTSMADAILAIASTLKSQGRDATLAFWMNKLPAQLLADRPWLLYWHGSSKAAIDPEKSQAILEHAYGSFAAMNDVLGMVLTWSELIGVILTIHKDLRQIDSWVDEFDSRLGALLEQLEPNISSVATLAYFDALAFRQPLHGRMPSLLRKVIANLEAERRAVTRADLRYRLVRYYLLYGRHADAESMLEVAHQGADGSVSARSPRALVDYVSEAMVALHTGMGERCLGAVAKGLKAAEESGQRLVEADLLQYGATMSLNRGDLPRADKFIASFERLAEALPFVDRGAYYAVSAWLKYHAGEPPLALALMQKTVAASETRGTSYYVASDYIGYGLLLHLCGETREASRYLEMGRRSGISSHNAVVDFAYHLFAGYVALDGGNPTHALEHVARGMRIGREHGYMHFFYFPQKVIARLALLALEHGIETAYVRSLIVRNEIKPDPAWRQAESWPWHLRIYTLGRFSVIKDDVALRFSGKAQKKPLDLLKALIALGGRDVSESKLADILWPEAEGDAASQALATTLFRLRRLLGDHAIHRGEGRVTLDPRYCWVDCWEFERLSSDESIAPPVRLARLRRLYQGKFLETSDDAPWAEPMRQRLYSRLVRLSRAEQTTPRGTQPLAPIRRTT